MKNKLLPILLVLRIIILAGSLYFVYSTSKSTPTTLTLDISPESDDGAQFSNVKSKLTFVLLQDNKVYGYYGDRMKEGKIVSPGETFRLVEDGWKMFSKDSLIVLIKPSGRASYKCTVDILDIMTNNQISRYAMVAPDKNEKEFLKIDG